MINKTFAYQTFVCHRAYLEKLRTYNGKILLAFCQGNQGAYKMASSLQRSIILAVLFGDANGNKWEDYGKGKNPMVLQCIYINEDILMYININPQDFKLQSGKISVNKGVFFVHTKLLHDFIRFKLKNESNQLAFWVLKRVRNKKHIWEPLFYCSTI